MGFTFLVSLGTMLHMGIGSKQKERAKRLGLKSMRICVEADDMSVTTLNSFFNDDPKVQASTIRRVIEAIDRLEARQKAAQVAG